MKVVTRSGLFTFALLASAALGFSQVASVFGPTGRAQVPASPTTTTNSTRSGPAAVIPGTINYVEGQALLEGRPLPASGSIVLKPGQVLATGDGFVEVLLTPGSFLRVGHNSQVRLNSAGLANAEAEIDHGTAMLEVDELINGTKIGVRLSNTNVQIDKKGLYNFDADVKAVRVLDGKLNVVEAQGTKKIGKGDQLLLASANPVHSTGFNAKTLKTEPLYVWSEARSRAESQSNVTLAQNVATYGGWYGPGWYRDPYWSFYAYLPGSGLLYSPFGWGFYSPAFVGYYGAPYVRYGRYGTWHGYVGGVHTSVNGFRGSSMGGFHGGGFHGGRR